MGSCSPEPALSTGSSSLQNRIAAPVFLSAELQPELRPNSRVCISQSSGFESGALSSWLAFPARSPFRRGLDTLACERNTGCGVKAGPHAGLEPRDARKPRDAEGHTRSWHGLLGERSVRRGGVAGLPLRHVWQSSSQRPQEI